MGLPDVRTALNTLVYSFKAFFHPLSSLPLLTASNVGNKIKAKVRPFAVPPEVKYPSKPIKFNAFKKGENLLRTELLKFY